MARFVTLAAALGLWLAAFATASAQKAAPAHTHDHEEGWTIPEGAEKGTSPLTVNASVVAAGQKLFNSKCKGCHGKLGKGDGPDAEPKYKKDMDLTNPDRASKNPDGVVFYRIWNGRKNPKMPVFSRELSKEQVWALVAYVQTLRGK